MRDRTTHTYLFGIQSNTVEAAYHRGCGVQVWRADFILCKLQGNRETGANNYHDGATANGSMWALPRKMPLTRDTIPFLLILSVR